MGKAMHSYMNVQRICCCTVPAALLNPHQNDQGEKGLAFFKGLNVLSVKKFKKISIPSLGSFLSSEPNFTLRK
jgi:hypothetical protein